MANYRSIRFVLYYTMVLNLVVTVAKLVVGYTTGSLSVIADGYDSFFDSASNVVGLVGIYIASRPPDPSHPYGYRKFETLAAASISGLLFLTTVEVVKSAIARFRHPVVPEVNLWTVAALLLSIGVHLYVASYEHRRGKELKSEVLVADSLHTRADVLVSAAVLVGMMMVRLGYPIVDPILALVIAALIAKVGYEIIRDTSKILSDAAAVDEETVRGVVTQVPGVVSYHRIRSRGQEDDVHLDLHVRVAPETAIERAHAIAHEVQARLLANISGARDVVIHIEPQRIGDGAPDLAQRVRQLAGREAGTEVHSVQVREVGAQRYITLHIEVAEDLSVVEAHAQASRIEETIRAEIADVADVDVHVEPRGARHDDAEPVDPATLARVRAELDRATATVEGLGAYREVRVLRHEGALLISGHWACTPSLSIERAHELTRALEQGIRSRLPEASEVVVHLEPAAAG
ncbi:MAG: cation diffusion facilitator family transporter [Chloroflexota bacterium]